MFTKMVTKVTFKDCHDGFYKNDCENYCCKGYMFLPG